MTESLGLPVCQLVTQSTRVTNNTSTLIDRIYSTNADNLSKVCVCQIGISVATEKLIQTLKVIHINPSLTGRLNILPKMIFD